MESSILAATDSDDLGIRALHDIGADTVLHWYEETVAATGIDPSAPWPVIDMPPLWEWDVAPTLEEQIRDLAVRVAAGRDVTDFLYRQQQLTSYLMLRDKEKADAAVDAGGPGQASRLGAAVAGGSGGVDEGGSEDGDPVGEGEPAAVGPDVRGAPKVRRGRRKTQVAGGPGGG